ncbi:olfactomedin-like [Ambystoma mexicanum]|uniref:olfactomedin-like n=1 Tax=Ambystoma mexicanum TaxID=8296 RepID=UPI0037E940E4
MAKGIEKRPCGTAMTDPSHSHESNTDVENVTGVMDENGVCLCTIILPDNTFPAHRMESLEVTAHNLTISVQQEIIKIHSYQKTLNIYVEKITNLTRRVEKMEGSSYTELDFQLLKLEIQEMESLILELKVSMGGSNIMVETLYEEIRSISEMVSQLEVYDKNNVLAVRREIASLRERLQECKNNQTKPPPPPSYGPPGTCDHGGLASVGRPYVVQLNYKGYSYRYGGWGKDSLLNTKNSDLYWIAPLVTDGRTAQFVRIYPTLDDLLLSRNPTDKYHSSYPGQGGGMILYNKTLYYNSFNKGDICKYDVQSNINECKTFPNAAFNNRFSYSGVSYQDIDFSGDEAGLWVIYATEESVGDIVISKLNASSLTIEKSWTTNLYKRGVSNAFMICGVLYATRTLNSLKEEIFYTYDTKTSQESRMNIVIDKMMGTVQSLSYNPNDHKLYMFNDAYEVTYDVTFKKVVPQIKKPKYSPTLKNAEITSHGI